jgi:hypothetical protein
MNRVQFVMNTQRELPEVHGHDIKGDVMKENKLVELTANMKRKTAYNVFSLAWPRSPLA